MLNAVIYVTDKYVNGNHFSFQQAHLQLYVDGQLTSLEVRDFKGNLLEQYRDIELARFIGSGVMKGRRVGTNRQTGESEFYYLGDR